MVFQSEMKKEIEKAEFYVASKRKLKFSAKGALSHKTQPLSYDWEMPRQFWKSFEKSQDLSGTYRNFFVLFKNIKKFQKHLWVKIRIFLKMSSKVFSPRGQKSSSYLGNCEQVKEIVEWGEAINNTGEVFWKFSKIVPNLFSCATWLST